MADRDCYVNAVKRELGQRKGYLDSDAEIETIYFGGGTPSILKAEQLCDILRHIKATYNVSDNAEITTEGNPDDLTPDYLATLIQGGFNRLSMGIQTFCDERLKFLCRRHNSATAITAIGNARKAGFHNISIDLMYGFPNETLPEWTADIDQALALQPEHISAYALMYEEGTRLTRMLEEGIISEVDEELSLLMYDALIDKLHEAGYEHYEISNFCQPHHHSRHNSSYWEGTPYLGLGAAAHSYDGHSRQWNPESLTEYLQGIESGTPVFERETLTHSQLYDEMIMTRLRTSKGLSLKTLEERFGRDKLEYCIRNAQPHIQAGRMKISNTNNTLFLTRKGIFVSDDIMSDLMS